VLDPLDRPPLQLEAMLGVLAEHEVPWVLSGSVALAAYGARIEPNDLDVVPATDPTNLRRLARVLRDLAAVPAHHPGWAPGLSVAECMAWTAEPLDAERFDHVFVTRLGLLDVPTRLTGTYAQLRPGASLRPLGGQLVWVCDPATVLRGVASTDRAKDRERAAAYEQVRRRLAGC